MSDLDFAGRNVLVVGGSSGIGNGIARAFLERAAHVFVLGTRARPEDYSAEEGSNLSGLHYTQLDAADETALASYQPPFERLDALVLSQGTVVYRRGEFERAGWRQVMAVNLDSVMACAVKFKPLLASARGTLIIISSVSAFRSNRGNPAYAASKAALVNLTRTLGEAWAQDGIRVNGIAPGLLATKLTKVTTEHPQRLAATLAAIPMGRLGQPVEIGGVALFLASHLASYMTGQTLIVDGGLTCA
ncbi:MAG TPA: SDR family oxidoreductase [Steroidobacteraceae bacterium]|nr:SDR family oxidoreductase [Steroidobacteraceae bacterium]